MNQLKIMFIAPSNLPIPAILGGGMEQLLQNIIEVNEVEKKFLIQVVTPYNNEAFKLQNKYKQSTFLNIKYYFFYKIYNFLFRNIYKITNKEFFHYYLIKINKLILSSKPERVIIWGNDEQISSISKVVPHERLYYCLATLRFQKVNKFDLCSKILIGSNHSINEINKASDFKFKEKLFRIQSAIDINYFNDNFSILEKKEAKEKLGLNYDYPIISYLGRIVESKGALVLLNAAVILKERGLKFNLLLLGNLGSGFGNNKSIIETNENNLLSEKINSLYNLCVHTGFVKSDLLPLYMSLADIAVVPSIVEDISPLAYFQWQSMGVATIVSDAGGIPEFFSEEYSLMFQRGENMVEQLANHLEYLINNPDLRFKMGIAALRMRSMLNINRYYSDFVDLVLN